MRHLAIQPSLLLCLALLCGCERKVSVAMANSPEDNTPASSVATPASSPTTASTIVMRSFEHKDTGLHAEYPSNWISRKDKDYELMLVPADGTSGKQITIDVPDLPPHFPGMIKLGLIESGFIRDLKSQHKGVHIDRAEDHSANGGAKARLVESSWTENGKPRKQVALLMMRGEHVYILAYECDAADTPQVQQDYDKVAASLRWSK